ncbi:hypothetical protein LTR96_010905 [Exophiala xenobiotica]|nr:hypothetical protein LTR92_010735 [Exophiala xenobiotica]KAK5203281.1 hypothetical protein LTR41_011005 [Exophiala xenobiotica]KAK5215620.1 hypothetical protein LTR72_011334 [Exophiala xenobiotica]KAK5220239.1 hypothetical protein LTR47_011323 [Exophiala xenobiotica]KAK5244475.1 hypothetical protein LTS06_009959 [Exophiala xenobiotica]
MLWKTFLAGFALWATTLAYAAREDDFGVPTSETGYDNATFGALDSAAITVTVKQSGACSASTQSSIPSAIIERLRSSAAAASGWVDKDDPKWKDYPPRMGRKNGKWVKGVKRKIVRTQSEEYDDLVGGYFSDCGYWKPRDPGEYTWVINHLGDYGMKDVDKNGKIIGEEKWNAEEGGK